MNKKNVLFALFAFLFAVSVYAQSHISTQPHQDTVTMIALNTTMTDKSFFSAGLDGFLIKWTDDGLGEHYQLSDLGIRKIACSPDGQDIAVYETDGGSINRVSVWNWKTLSRKYTYRFTNVITDLSFSKKGSYLIIGTAAVNGLIFIDARTGKTAQKIRDSTGIVSMAVTSATENSMVTYSPAGILTYYNLRNGKQHARFNTVQGLSQPTLFNRNMFFTGVKNDTIYVIQAMTGKTISTIPAGSPLLLCSENDTDLCYMAYNGKMYTLNTLKIAADNTVLPPQTLKTFYGLDDSDLIVSGVKSGDTVMLGTRQGALYDTSITADTTTGMLRPLTNDIYDKITDIAQNGEDFYFLTGEAVFKSSYDNGSVKRIVENDGQTNIIANGDHIILWSKQQRKPIQMVNSATGAVTKLFSPAASIQSLRLFDNTLVDIEGNSTVNSFAIDKMEKEQLYTGTGLQDMVLYTGTDLYVAKSAATSPKSALIYINTQTKETVPVMIAGTVAYSLNYDTNVSSIYGISVSENSGNGKTDLFSFNPATRQTYSILELQEENPDAFSMLYYPIIYTNMGKSQVQSYNLQSHRGFLYRRSASLPLKIARNKNRLVVLNRDGSVSWYNPNTATVLADWYLTNDGQWFEF